jgi:DNA-binding CsgD family transcriptional regulator
VTADILTFDRKRTWTPDRIGALCRGYMRGHRFEDIAPRLGVTKSAAVGKFNRLLKEGHALARQAADARSETTESRVAEWMATYGGTVAQCARCLGITEPSARNAWTRIKRKLGRQAR